MLEAHTPAVATQTTPPRHPPTSPPTPQSLKASHLCTSCLEPTECPIRCGECSSAVCPDCYEDEQGWQCNVCGQEHLCNVCGVCCEFLDGDDIWTCSYCKTCETATGGAAVALPPSSSHAAKKCKRLKLLEDLEKRRGTVRLLGTKLNQVRRE